MGLVINLLVLVIFGLVGFVISKIFGFNPYRIFTDLTTAIIIISMLIIMFPAIMNPENALDTIPNFIQFFAESLPGIIIGDVAGSFVAGITD